MSDSTTTRHFCVYKIANSINEKLYIGVTTRTLKTRWKQHLRDAPTSQFTLHRAIVKHGAENFTIEVLEECPDHKTMLARECYWIQHYNTMVPNGYNITAGGQGLNGVRLSEEHKRKLSNKPITPQFRERMRTIANARAQDPEYIAKLSKASSGRRVTETAKEKIRQARSQQVFTPEVIEKRTQKLRGMKHTPLSIEHMSQAQQGRYLSPDHRQKIRETLRQLTPEQAAIIKFDAYGLMQKEYADLFQVSPQTVCGIVKGRQYAYITRSDLPLELRGDIP